MRFIKRKNMDKKVFNIRFNTLTDISIIKDQLVIEGFCDQQNLNFEKQIFLISTTDHFTLQRWKRTVYLRKIFSVK